MPKILHLKVHLKPGVKVLFETRDRRNVRAHEIKLTPFPVSVLLQDFPYEQRTHPRGKIVGVRGCNAVVKGLAKLE